MKTLPVYVLGSMIVIALLLRVSTWMIPDRQLLSKAEGLIIYPTIDQLLHDVAFPRSLIPAQVGGASPFVLGYYSKPSPDFPTGTISVVYVRDGWRALEIDHLPDRTIEQQRALLSQYPQEEIQLTEKDTVVLVTRSTSPRCVKYNDHVPDKCEISSQLLVQKDSWLISISSDGNHVTIGELIELAKTFFKNE